MLSLWPVQDYVLLPGVAQPVLPKVTVTGLPTESHDDHILLTDVILDTSPMSVLQWIGDQLRSDDQTYPISDFTPPGVPSSELVNQGYVDMATSKQSAAYAALTTLGWHVPSRPAGALVYGVDYPSSAWRAGLRVADRIIAVDGTPTPTMCSVIAATHPMPVGATVRLTVEPARVSGSGTITLGADRVMDVVTSATPSGVVDVGCAGVSGAPRSVIGVELDQAVDDTFPARIDVDTSDIGGPSAGLAMTLALLSDLSKDPIAGGRIVAATGTISPDGAVGDVGGVPEKTVAVERAGANVFIVPEVEVAAAQSQNNGTLTILGVTSLRQALADLRRLGGHAPVPITRPYPIRATS